jgi:hypothetical protein
VITKKPAIAVSIRKMRANTTSSAMAGARDASRGRTEIRQTFYKPEMQR